MKKYLVGCSALVLLCGVALKAVDYTHAYVTNFTGDSVSVIDLAALPIATVTGKVHDLVPATFIRPLAIGIRPNGATAYVVNQFGNSVSIVDLAAVGGPEVTAKVIDLVPATFALPRGIDITPNGSLACVTNYNGDSVSIIDLMALPRATVQGLADPNGFPFHGPLAVAIAPDGKTAYVTNCAIPFYSVSIIDLTALPIPKVIGLVTDLVPATFQQPSAIAITPDGKMACVTNQSANSVSIIDLAAAGGPAVTNTVTDLVIPTFNQPVGIAITPDGKMAYVVNQGGGSVSIIDLAAVGGPRVTNTVIGVFHYPQGIAIASDGALAYVTNFTSNSVSVIDLNAVPWPTVMGLVTDLVPATFSGPSAIGMLRRAFPQEPTDLKGIQTVMGDVTRTIQPAVAKTDATFFTQIDWINALAWGAPVGVPTPVSYNVYRDAALTQLIGTASGATPSFADHNRTPGATYTYYVSPQVLTNVLSWNAPTSGTAPAEYRVYRDAALNILAGPAIPATTVPLQFIDYNRVAGTPDTYYVVSVDEFGNKSTAVSVTVA
jgi:YVTN family beta-propeller protein